MMWSIREAVAGGEYDRALTLWQEYAAGIAAGPTPESLAEAAGLIEWARPLLEAARSDVAERLRLLHVAGAYGGTGSRPYPKFRESF
jgi:hypothetical protein